MAVRKRCQNGSLAHAFSHKTHPAYVLPLPPFFYGNKYITLLQHCSISGPSVCTLEYVREYFLSGKLPPEGMICPVIMPPFPDLSLNVLHSESVRAGGERNDVVFSLKGEDKDVDGKMWDVAYELSNAWKPFDWAFL